MSCIIFGNLLGYNHKAPHTIHCDCTKVILHNYQSYPLTSDNEIVRSSFAGHCLSREDEIHILHNIFENKPNNNNTNNYYYYHKKRIIIIIKIIIIFLL